MHTESDRRHLPSVIERFVLRGGIRTTFPPGSFGQTSEQINSVEAFLSPAEATPRETLREKDDAGSNSTKGVKKGGSKEGREVFIFSRVDTKTSGGLHYGGPKGRITHRRCRLDWIFRLLELLS